MANLSPLGPHPTCAKKSFSLPESSISIASRTSDFRDRSSRAMCSPQEYNKALYMSGEQLESLIKNRWIKLPPNAVYTTRFAEAKASLNQLGDWRIRAQTWDFTLYNHGDRRPDTLR